MNSTTQFPWWFAFIPAGILVLLAGLCLFGPRDGIAGIHESIFALYQRVEPWQPAKHPSGEIRPANTPYVILIDLDAQSLAEWGARPRPRDRLAQTIEKAGSAGAAAIIIGMIPSGSDPYSVQEIAARLPDGPEHEAVLAASATIIDSDDMLEAAIKNHPVIVSISLSGDQISPLPKSLSTIAYSGEDPRNFIAVHDSGHAPLERFTQPAQGIGHLNLNQANGRTGYLPLFIRTDDAYYPAAILEALRVTQGADSFLVNTRPPVNFYNLISKTGIETIRSGSYSIPSRFDGTYRLHFSASTAPTVIPAWQVLEEAFDTAPFRGAIVLIAASGGSTGRGDWINTPSGQRLTPVEVHAHALEQILSGHHLVRPSWAETVETISIIAIGLLVILLLNHLAPGPVYAFGGIVIVAQTIGAWAIFSGYGLLLDPIGPAIAILIVMVSADVVHRILTQSNTQFLRDAFQGALADDALEALANRSGDLKFDGCTKEVTSLVGGVRGFSEISATYDDDPRALARLINRLLTVLSFEVTDRRGFIDSFIGDGVVALWNAPVDDDAHPVHACGCALRMVEAVDGLNNRLEHESRRQHRPYIPLILGIGIDTGEALVGNLGSDQRFHYTSVGEPVDVATALEHQSKYYGPAIVVSQETRNRINERFAFLEVDYLRLHPRSDPIKIYALLGDTILRASPRFRALESAHERIFTAYRSQNWDEARGHIQECRKLSGAIETLYDLYESRIAYFEVNPPAAEWEGAHTTEDMY